LSARMRSVAAPSSHQTARRLTAHLMGELIGAARPLVCCCSPWTHSREDQDDLAPADSKRCTAHGCPIHPQRCRWSYSGRTCSSPGSARQGRRTALNARNSGSATRRPPTPGIGLHTPTGGHVRTRRCNWPPSGAFCGCASGSFCNLSTLVRTFLYFPVLWHTMTYALRGGLWSRS